MFKINEDGLYFTLKNIIITDRLHVLTSMEANRSEQ